MASIPTNDQPARVAASPFAVIDDRNFLWERDSGSDTYTCRYVYGPSSGWSRLGDMRYSGWGLSQPLGSINVRTVLQTEAQYLSYVFRVHALD